MLAKQDPAGSTPVSRSNVMEKPGHKWTLTVVGEVVPGSRWHRPRTIEGLPVLRDTFGCSQCGIVRWTSRCQWDDPSPPPLRPSMETGCVVPDCEEERNKVSEDVMNS